MRSLLLTKLGLLVLMVAAATVAGQKAAPSYVENELLIKFAPGTKDTVKKSAMRRTGSKMLEKLDDLGWVRIQLPPGLAVKAAIDRYNEFPEIAGAQPNFYYHLLNTPNDPLFSNLWGLIKISAPAAWDVTTGSSSVVVADIDTGMRYTHEDLAPNVWTNPGEIPNNGIDDDGNGFIDDYYGYDFRYNRPDPMDENGHGTHTAGIIGAAGNNGLGVVGVNWNVKIMPIKIYSAAANDSTSAMLVNAYSYIRMMKNRGVNIRVTNNSYGDCPEACGYDQATKDGIDAMGDAGILNVFAAGNNNNNNDIGPFYPASYDSPSILAVAASDQNDAKASFSNFGPTSVDIAAPGVSIESTWFQSDSSYTYLSGTSMAAPHVAGAAALLASLNPNLSMESLKATLMNTADVLPAWNGIVKSGGRLNIAKALQNQTVCTFTLGANSIVVPTRGGYSTVEVTSPPNCDFKVKSNDFWIHPDGPGVMSGNSTVRFRVTVNPTITRSGTITIAGQTFTVKQSRVPI